MNDTKMTSVRRKIYLRLFICCDCVPTFKTEDTGQLIPYAGPIVVYARSIRSATITPLPLIHLREPIQRIDESIELSTLKELAFSAVS